MIIVCQKCSTRLQVDDEKSPQRPFNVRCPKCNNTVSSGPGNPATEHSALAVGGSPATEHPRFEQSTARAYAAVQKAISLAGSHANPKEQAFIQAMGTRYTGRFDAARKAAGGSGLGLSIVKAIVERHGGRISARNDGGAVFEIVLPSGVLAS